MADSAIVALNASEFKGQTIVVEHGRPKERKQNGPGGNQMGGGGGPRGGRGGGGGGGRGILGKFLLNVILQLLLRLEGKPTVKGMP